MGLLYKSNSGLQQIDSYDGNLKRFQNL